jgi:CSLREA domain-containing protein
MSRVRAVCAALVLTVPSVAVAVALDGPSVGALTPVTFQVSTTADGVDATPGDSRCATAAGQCSLRAAVQEANRTLAPTTIMLAAGRYNLGAVAGGTVRSGSRALEISSNVNIVGAGADSTVLVAGPGHRAIKFTRSFSTTQTITSSVSGVTISGGTSSYGAGAYVGGGYTLSFTDVVFENNNAPGMDSAGGGLYVDGIGNTSHVTLLRTTFIHNTAGNAGAIVNQWPSVMTITDSTITSNTARGTFAGGIRNMGTMTLNNSTITANRAGTQSTSGGPGGGGVYTGDPPAPNSGQRATFTMNGGAIIGNSVPLTLTSNGGGLLGGAASTTNLNGVTVAENTAFTGGGLLNEQGAMNLLNVTVAKNTAFFGGGVYNDDFGPTNQWATTMVVNRSAIVFNSATDVNCPYYLMGPGALCGAGGGLFNENGDVNVVNSTVAENTAATYGAGLYSMRIGLATVSQAILRLNNATVSANRTGSFGGGVLNNAGTLQMRNSIIAGNFRGAIADDCFVMMAGSVNTSFGNNISSVAHCGLNQATDKVTSPALNNGDNGACAASPVSNLDQRGNARPLGAKCDIGAIEGELTTPVQPVVPTPVIRVQPKPKRGG